MSGNQVLLAALLLFSLLFSVIVPQLAAAGFFERVSKSVGELEAFKPTAVHRVSEVPALRAAVNLDPNPAKGGGDITVVSGAGGPALASEEGPSGTNADVLDKQSNGQISVYVVRGGDTLSEIARMFGVSVNTIAWANDLVQGSIKPGQTLVILPVTGVRHTVVKGETIKGITKKYDGDIDEVLRYNGLTAENSLAVGDIIVVPHGEIPAPSYSGSSAPRVAFGGGGPELIGYFLRPLVSGKKTQGIHGYNGVDLAAPVGTPILASASGPVIIAKSGGWNGGYGNYAVIKHDNGTQTLYAHASSLIVSPGQTVVQGQVIGYVGDTGRSTGPHLHFEVRGARNLF